MERWTESGQLYLKDEINFNFEVTIVGLVKCKLEHILLKIVSHNQ